MYWNVHLDGLERTHDLIVEREGVFKECISRLNGAGARIPGRDQHHDLQRDRHAGNRANVRLPSDLGVDGHTISPGYEYDAAKQDMIKRLNLAAGGFLPRAMTIQKFQKIENWMNRYTLFGTPVYFEFLAGKRDLTCSAWAIPDAKHPRLERPCYLMTDGHFSSYAELLEQTDWNRYGVVDGVARDSRCENCMVHCGYEPTATLGLGSQRGDTWKNDQVQFWRKAEV